MGFEITRVNSLPVWLSGPVARAYQGGCGADQDDAWEAMKAAIKLRWAMRGCIKPSDDEGLAYAGEIRRIDRAPGEDGARYLERLGRAHEIWYWAGTSAGLLQAFEPYFAPIEGGFVGARGETIWLDAERDADLIARQRGLGRVSPERWIKHYAPSSTRVQVWDYGSLGGPWWANGDAAHPWWSRVVVVLDSRDGPWTTDGTFADPGTFADDGLIGSTITQFELYNMRAAVRRFKQYSAYPFYIAVVLEGDGLIGFLPSGEETINDDALATFGDEHEVVFLRMGHAQGEGVLWGLSPEGTFGDPGTFDTIEI